MWRFEFSPGHQKHNQRPLFLTVAFLFFRTHLSEKQKGQAPTAKKFSVPSLPSLSIFFGRARQKAAGAGLQ
jgi:hypothetical protein